MSRPSAVFEVAGGGGEVRGGDAAHHAAILTRGEAEELDGAPAVAVGVALDAGLVRGLLADVGCFVDKRVDRGTVREVRRGAGARCERAVLAGVDHGDPAGGRKGVEAVASRG